MERVAPHFSVKAGVVYCLLFQTRFSRPFTHSNYIATAIKLKKKSIYCIFTTTPRPNSDAATVQLLAGALTYITRTETTWLLNRN